MVEQPKYLEMTLSQLKSYVESSESNVFFVVELLQRILFDAIICRIRKIKTSHF